MNAARISRFSRLGAILLLLCTAGCTRAERTAPSVDVADTVRVLAYNIHHGAGMDEVLDLDRIAAFIRTFEPDLVTLQEIDSVTTRTGGVDQAAVLGELTGLTPAFGRFMPYRGGAYGMAVLSAWPVLEATNLRLPDGEEPRTALAVRVRSPRAGAEIVVVGIHLYRTDEERLAQAIELEAHLANESSPVILAGDFNSLPDSEVMTHLGAEWHVLPKGSDRFTYPSDVPAREIDYVLVRPVDRFEILEHGPLDEPVLSDHRPILVDLIVRSSGPR